MARPNLCWAAAAATILVSVVGSDMALAQGRPSQMAQLGYSNDPHPSPSKEELAGLGCIFGGTAAVLVVMATGAAAGGASASALALPVLGTAFTAGCGVGVMVAPGAAWLIDHYVLGSHRFSEEARVPSSD